ncbi:MAG: LTA synthase family protein [Muribaculaceae bacterium]|nr:LTA synthase family protein [Muribaculaceae bacterium]
MNVDTIASAKALVSIFDIIYLIIPLGLTILYVGVLRSKIKKDDLKVRAEKIRRLTILAITVCLFFLSQIGYAITKTKWNIAAGYREQSVVENLFLNMTCITNGSVYDLRTRGLCLFLYSDFVNILRDLTMSHKIEPTPEEMDSLKSFITNVPQFPIIEEFSANGNKNVVIIIVESLNAGVINKTVNGHEVSPFLNFLVKSEGSVSALDILPQVKDGCSNDGQLLTNTGLLPLSQGVVSMTLGTDIDYPGLPKILKPKSSVAIFGDSGLSWNQTQAFQSYGFDEIYTVLDFEEDADDKGADAAMFDFSEGVLDRIEQPFLLEYVTFSMHAPFTHKSIPTKEWLASSNLETNEINYLNSVNYTDSQICKFFDNLNRRGLMQSTVVFIVSDHSQTLGLDKSVLKHIKEDSLDLMPMAFIAVNTGVTKKIDSPAGQINVFPTILHVLGKGNGEYRGLDRSLLDPALSSSVSAQGKSRGEGSDAEICRQKRAWQVSDSLLRSNFFKTNL